MTAVLHALIAQELGQQALPEAERMAAHLRGHFGAGVRAILFYGSCLRRGSAEGILDFYVLAERYRAVHKRALSAFLNRLLPPNVYFFQLRTGDTSVRAKVAVMSVDQFRRRVRPESLDTTIWARFAQPARLLYAGSDAVRDQTIGMIAQAVRTAVAWGKRFSQNGDARALWCALFARTYRAELRAERNDRAALIYDTDPARYDAFLAAIGASTERAKGSWPLRHATVKGLSVLRLVKGAFTFDGAVDYILYKIERHTGTAVELTPWQRRHPVLSAPRVLLMLRRKGLVR